MPQPSQLVVEVMLPPQECSPNSRMRPKDKKQIIASYRAECRMLVRSAMNKQQVAAFERVEISYDFYLAPAKIPDGRYGGRDRDNMLGAMKAFQDALKDARLLPKGDSHRRVSFGALRLHSRAEEHGGRRCVVATIVEVLDVSEGK